MQAGKWYEIRVQGPGAALSAADVQALVQQMAAELDGVNQMTVQTNKPDKVDYPATGTATAGAVPLYMCHSK